MRQFRDTDYYVTEDGNVYRKWKFKGFKKLKLDFNQGYLRATIFINNKPSHFRVNRMVAECYIPNPNNLPIVDHRDCNKLNNHVSNLEWVTDRENKDRAMKNELYPRGENHTNILTEDQVKWIRKNCIPRHKEFGYRPLGKKFGVYKSTIKSAFTKKTWTHI